MHLPPQTCVPPLPEWPWADGRARARLARWGRWSSRGGAVRPVTPPGLAGPPPLPAAWPAPCSALQTYDSCEDQSPGTRTVTKMSEASERNYDSSSSMVDREQSASSLGSFLLNRGFIVCLWNCYQQWTVRVAYLSTSRRERPLLRLGHGKSLATGRKSHTTPWLAAHCSENMSGLGSAARLVDLETYSCIRL